MKVNKTIALAIFAAMALAIAGPVCAGNGKGAARAGSVRAAGRFGGHSGVGPVPLRTNGRFFGQAYPYGYGYGGYGYGNQVYLNPDEADWAEEWRSLREDNDGPYAKSTFEGNPQGPARMWEFPDDTTAVKSSK